MEPSFLHGVEHSCAQRRRMFSSWMPWRFLSHQLHDKDHSIYVCENSHGFRESRCYENSVCTRKTTHLLLLDHGVILSGNIVFVLGSYDHFLCFTFSHSFVTMSSSKPIGVGRMNRLTRNSAERTQILNYYSLALSQLNIDLMCDEEIMNPERLAEAPENASIAPGAMKVRSGNKEQLAKMTSHTSHPQVAWATFLLERTGHLTKDESLSKTRKIGSR